MQAVVFTGSKISAKILDLLHHSCIGLEQEPFADSGGLLCLFVVTHDGFVIPAPIEDTANLDIARIQYRVGDHDPALKPDHPETTAQVIPLPPAFGKGSEGLAVGTNATDIRHSLLRIPAELGGVVIEFGGRSFSAAGRSMTLRMVMGPCVHRLGM